MPLMSIDEPGHWDFRTDNVYFCMTDGEHRVRCAITDRALEVLAPNFGRTEKGRLDAFEAHRVIIERAASGKFDTQEWEDDKITILIRSANL
jgi:Protein of unknown function (DUF1488)